MRRALARKLGWSSTIRTVFPIDLILAYGPAQIDTASRTLLAASRTRTGAYPNRLDACQPSGLACPPLAAWRHVRNPSPRRIDHEYQQHRYRRCSDHQAGFGSG